MRKHLPCSLLLLAVCLAPLLLHSQVPPMQGLFPPQPAPSPAQAAAEPAPSPSPTPIQAVPLPQIANQSEDLDRLLLQISKDLEPAAELSSGLAAAHASEVAVRVRQTEDLLAGIPSMMQLQNEDRYWRALGEQYGGQRKLLTDRAARIEEKMLLLDTQQTRWQATQEEVEGKSGLGAVASRIQRGLDSIKKIRSEAQEQLNQILTLQNDISEQDRQISFMLRRLEEAQDRLRGRLFERDSPPLWATRKLEFPVQSLSTVMYVSASRGFLGGRNFLRTHKGLVIGTVAMFLFALFVALRLKNYVAARGNLDDIIPGSRVFSRPIAVALLVTCLTTIGIAATAPTGISFVLSLLYLVPVLRLLPLLGGQEMRKIIYALSVFYALAWVYLVLQFGVVFRRELFSLIIFLAFVSFAWLTRSSVLQIKPVSREHPLLLAGIRVGLFLLAASVAGNILGYVALSQLLGAGTLLSAFMFALLYILVRILNLGLKIFLDSAWFQALPDAPGEVVERWGRRLLVLGGALLWINITLYLFTVGGSIVKTLRSIFLYPVGFGKVHITLGGTLGFVLLLLLGYAIANIASFILGTVLLPRVSLRGGLAYAISRVTYYVLLVALFFVALANAGLELNKFTVVTGALGVGVGFGLQNIVNNFASGLIILFERPIRVSDTVEIEGIQGTVRRIGARSSTVLTVQGAEVIFPNSTLLSNQVTNWTLSSTRRRVEIKVGVSYGTDPEVVLNLLTGLARGNPRVLSFPQPQSFFLGFGENSLEFELTFWAAQATWWELKSEIGLDVYRSLHKAGIEIPYPQRDLHVRSIEALKKEKEEEPPVSKVVPVERMARRG